MNFLSIFSTNQSAKINEKNFSKTFKIEDNKLLVSEINTFSVSLANMVAEDKINDVILEQVEDFNKYVFRTLYPLAISDYNSSNAKPFNHYQAVLNYIVTYNQACHLSFYFDEYFFTGGAHGSTLRRSNTYNLKNGNKVTLASVFNNKNYKDIIISEIITQADANWQTEQIYFENYEQLIKDNFNKRNFYLTKDGIVIYFNQYEIAPYSTGIVEFVLPYTLAGNPPRC